MTSHKVGPWKPLPCPMTPFFYWNAWSWLANPCFQQWPCLGSCMCNLFLGTGSHSPIAINGAYTICALNNDLSQMDQLKRNAWSNGTNPKLKPIGNAYGYISKQWLCLWVASQCLDQWLPPYECISNQFLVSHDHCSMNTIGACTICALTNDFSQMEPLKTIALSNDTIPEIKYMLLACKFNALSNCIV